MGMDADLRERLEASLGRAYTLERELRGAGMSRVFVAHDTTLGRRIVVKILPPEMAAGVSVERFRREIQLAASLVHPHILPLLSAGLAENEPSEPPGSGVPYYTMPFVDGETLRARLTREWRLELGDAIRIAREISLALDYAHRRDVVHRDIKPENILLVDGQAVVADFGIARAISRSVPLTAIGSSVGTPAYMSPEQGSGEPAIDGRSDIYGVGCVLHEMLTGSPPFTGLNARAILTRHLMSAVPQPSAARREISSGIDAVVMRALAKKPADRFASGAELARALDRVLRSELSAT